MSLPTSITSASAYDAGSDDPKQARTQLKGLHDDVEAINDHLKLSPLLSPATPLGVGDGLESSAGNLRVQLDSNPGLTRSGAGLRLGVEGLTAETAPAMDDQLGLYDASAAAHRRITLANLLKVVNGLTEEASPDSSNDYLLLYDVSAAAVRKVKPSSVASGVTRFVENTSHSDVASIEIGVSAFDEVEVWFDGMQSASVSQLGLTLEVKVGGTWLTTNEYEGFSQVVGNAAPGIITAAANWQVYVGGINRQAGFGHLRLSNLKGAVNKPRLESDITARVGPSGSVYQREVYRGRVDAGGAVTDIRFRVNAGAENLNGAIDFALGRTYA